MKKQYIIPIFVPHLGCPNECTFCNQRKISGQMKNITENDVRETIEYYLNNFKEKMLLAMYVVTNESKGEWFTVEDILCVLTDVLGESATRKQVEGVFTREKRWFKTDRVDEGSKIIRRKLLNEGKDFARSLQNKRVSPKN